MQHLRDSPPLVILRAHEVRGQRAEVAQRFFELLFDPLAVLDVGRYAIPFDDSTSLIAQRRRANQKLTIFPISTPQPHGIIVPLSQRHLCLPLFQDCWRILRMNGAGRI